MEVERQLNRARARVIETIAQNMNLYGVTPSVGRLYGAMFFYNKPLTLDDMKDVLGMSKTSMSTSIRTLADLKMVEKIWKKGVRKDLYIVEEDWYQTFIDLFSIKWRHGVTMNIDAIQKSLEELEVISLSEEASNEIRQLALQDIEKLKYALEYYDWLNRLVDSFESKEIFNYVPKKDTKK